MIRIFRQALAATLFVILGVAIYQTMLWLGVWGNTNESEVKALDDGDQEIALIEPATSFDDWGRLVTALKLLEINWPKINPILPALRIGLDDAFPPLTAEVPEVVFSFPNTPGQRLRLRWYKISGEHDAASWIRKLRTRPCPPLAIIGGGTSDRAIKLAYTMKKTFGDDPGAPSPALLITTATAEETNISRKSLIDVYRQRSFRFSFTNKKMVKALLDFVQRRAYPKEHQSWAENLWTDRPADAAVLAPAASGVVGFSAAAPGLPSRPSPTMHAFKWQDERYSQDMADLFETEFNQRYAGGEFIHEGTIPYSVGGFFKPSPQEETAVSTFLTVRKPIRPHSFLVLPTQTVRMRRFLINLRERSPLDARNLVILNGDAISFHSVYRDRDVIWRILDLPYSLVFFSHRNPIDHAAGFDWTPKDRPAEGGAFPQSTTTGTHDLLLYRDLFEAILYAAFDRDKLLNDPLEVRKRLQATCWHQPPPGKNAERARVCNALVQTLDAPPPPFFDAAGNRQSRTGEHIVWVKPNFTEDRVDKTSKISVWALQTHADGDSWQFVEAYPREDAP